MGLGALDLAVMAAYFAAVLAIGARFARKSGGAEGYFLGLHRIPWPVAMLSIVATETSALTVISVPGLGARGDLGFLQLAFGYLVGRAGVALWLLPGYFRGEQQTAYARLERRFGRATRRVASVVFMLIRALGDSVRVFATAIPLQLVTGLSAAESVLAVAAVTLAYTWTGGLRAVVWVDCLQLFVYTAGGVAAIAVGAELAGGLGPALAAANEAGKLQLVHTAFSFGEPYTLAAGLVGGALLSAASHGTDHLIVQRVLATADLRGARLAMVGSGVLVIVQFALFLFVGTLIWAAGADDGALPTDELFPRFALAHLPPGLAGLFVAGLFAAAMSTISSSLNSLAAATTYDLWASVSGESRPERLLRVGRLATVLWALVLAGGALAFRSEEPVVELALSVASITYGGLFGAYLLGGFPRVRQPDAIAALVGAALAMLALWLASRGPDPLLAWPLAWTWYVPLGTALALALGLASATLRRARTALRP